MSLAGKDAQIYTTGASNDILDEAMDPVGSGTPVLVWQVTDHAHDILDPSVTFIVEVTTDGGTSWSTASTSNYTIRYLSGVVEFDSDPFGGSTSGNDVRLKDGAYLSTYSLLEGFEQSVEYSRDLYDTTKFQDTGTRRGASGPLEITGDFTLNKIIERELDSDGGTEPTLREILLGEDTHGGAGTHDEFRVYRAQPNDSGADTLISVWVKFSDESLDASVGSKQERSYSMEAANQDAAMSSQTAKVADIFSASEI